MGHQTTEMGRVAEAVPAFASLRRSLRPGDLGAITGLHGSIYADEHGNDATFEAMVGRSVARAAERGWPDSGGFWAIDIDGELRGCIAFTDEGDGVACLRWVLLAPELRGHGLGRAMIAEVLSEIRSGGYRKAVLETFSDLRTAAAMYRAAGFEMVASETGPRWGRDSVTYQHYELDLASPEA